MVWCGAVWCGVVWCGVVCVVWSGVVWCGVVCVEDRKQEKRPCTLGDRALKHLAEANSCSLAAKPTSAAALDCTGPARPGR